MERYYVTKLITWQSKQRLLAIIHNVFRNIGRCATSTLQQDVHEAGEIDQIQHQRGLKDTCKCILRRLRYLRLN